VAVYDVSKRTINMIAYRAAKTTAAGAERAFP
jgi:hypothetical protein